MTFFLQGPVGYGYSTFKAGGMNACVSGNLTCRPAFGAMRIRNPNRPGGKIAWFFAFIKKAGTFADSVAT